MPHPATLIITKAIRGNEAFDGFFYVIRVDNAIKAHSVEYAARCGRINAGSEECVHEVDVPAVIIFEAVATSGGAELVPCFYPSFTYDVSERSSPEGVGSDIVVNSNLGRGVLDGKGDSVETGGPRDGKSEGGFFEFTKRDIVAAAGDRAMIKQPGVHKGGTRTKADIFDVGREGDEFAGEVGEAKVGDDFFRVQIRTITDVRESRGTGDARAAEVIVVNDAMQAR